MDGNVRRDTEDGPADKSESIKMLLQQIKDCGTDAEILYSSDDQVNVLTAKEIYENLDNAYTRISKLLLNSYKFSNRKLQKSLQMDISHKHEPLTQEDLDRTFNLALKDINDAFDKRTSLNTEEESALKLQKSLELLKQFSNFLMSDRLRNSPYFPNNMEKI